jgi:S1-C subfamily serine protease
MPARAFAALVAFACLAADLAGATDARETIQHVKASVVAVGTFERTRSPEFEFRGTGFVAGGGNTIVTNAHVLPETVDPVRREAVAVLVPGGAADTPKVRSASVIAIDTNVDLALLRVDGDPLPVLQLMNSDAVQEGQEVLITGYPLGPVLGAFATTHRGMVSAIAPIAIPQPRAHTLDSAVASRLKRGVFSVFQLDATAYPGNSGSPVYDPATGKVLGVVNMVFVKGTKEAALTNPSGITYAMPVSHLQSLLDRNRINSESAK